MGFSTNKSPPTNITSLAGTPSTLAFTDEHGVIHEVPLGANGTVLVSHGSLLDPTWDTVSLADATTSSNVNSTGVGVFKQEVGDALQFKGIKGGSVKVSVADSTLDNTVAVDVVEVNFTVFTGDTGSGGAKGVVPAPVTGDATKFLKGDGTWATPAGGGSTAWSSITGTPTTLSGYGITNGQTLDATLTALAALTGAGYIHASATDTFAMSTTIPWSAIASTPTTLAGYGITDAASTAHHTTHVTGGSDVIADAVAGGASGLLSGSDNTKLNNTSGTNTGDQTISDATLTTSNITTNNVSITKHGFAPLAPNDATKFLDGTGNWTTPAGGSGEVNTASNVGTGQGVFKQKTTYDLEFYKLKAASTKITVALSTNDITFDVNEANLTNMVGDTGSGGTHGLVPAPGSGDAAAGKYLGAGGTWSIPTVGNGQDGNLVLGMQVFA